VAKSVGLLPPNHYLAACVHYLFSNRPRWSKEAAVGKTVVSSSFIDLVTARLSRKLYEVPVGFKWFVDGLLDGRLGFVGEESAGATCLRRDGTAWTTDKDGIAVALLAAEMTARTGRDPGEIYGDLTRECGDPVYERIDAPATQAQKTALGRLSPEAIRGELAGEPVRQVLTSAPGDGQPIGGVKVVSDGGWFAARPSGTEEIYKIYAESFRDRAHLRLIQDDAQRIVTAALAAAS
jgi:phosphoglucomutase